MEKENTKKEEKVESAVDSVVAPSDTDKFEGFIGQQKLLVEKLDKIIEKQDENNRKDKWDKISSSSGLFTFLGSIAIGLVGIYFTNVYKIQDTRITETQTIEKFLPYLNSQSLDTRRGALLAVHGLQNYELASRLAASYAAPDNIDVCETILKTASGDAREQLIDGLVEAIKTRTEAEYNDPNSRVDREELIRNYNKIFKLRNDDEILEKRGKWYLASIYTGRGNLYRDLKNYNMAIADYQKSFQVYPDFYWTFLSQGRMNADRGEYKSSINDLKKAIELYPNYGLNYLNLGYTYQKMGDLEQAELQYNKAVELEPLRIDLHFGKANFYFDNEMFSEAENAYIEIYKLSKDETDQNLALHQLRKINPKYSKKMIDESNDEVNSLPLEPENTQKPFK